MKDDDRRKEIGRMLLDISKYLTTVGLIGGILTNTLTLFGGLIVFVVVSILVTVAYFIIPEKKGDKNV